MLSSHKALLVALLFGILVASCGGAPGITVTVGDQAISTVLASTSTRTVCSGTVGDWPAPTFAPTSVRGSVPLSIRLEAGPGATEMRGWVYELDASNEVRGPIEEFSVLGRSGLIAPRTIVAGRSYQVLVNIKWSALITQGEETRVFRVKVETQ